MKALKSDYCLVPAAISDFTTRKTKGKIPSRKGGITLDLTPTPKILKAIRAKTKGVLVGFKAEFNVPAKVLEEKAKAMIKESKLDFAVANDLKEVKRDRTKVLFIDGRGGKTEIQGTKSSVADKIWSAVLHGL